METLVQQLDASRASAEEQEKVQHEAIQRLDDNLAGLQRELQQQRDDLQGKIKRREAHIRVLEASFLYRVLAKLGLFLPPFVGEDKSEPVDGRQGEEQMR